MTNTPLPTPPRVMTYRAIGLAVVAASTVACALFAARYPWLTGINSAIAWYVGKLLGIPLDDVVRAALVAMTPDRAVVVAVDALRSMPPEAAADATRTLLRSMPPPPAAVGPVQIIPDPADPLTAPPPAGKPPQQ